MADLIGHRLGQYEITGLIGEGDKATVYQALQTSHSRTVAVKVIESRLARNADFVRRFKREAEAIAALSHPHIRKLFDFGEQDDLLYLVMELLPGGSLAERIRERRLTGARVAHYLNQIASALDYAHGESIIHRDLKPQNVLLDKQGNAILTDFGIARLLSADATNPMASGVVMGTPAYMAPEQWHSRDIDGRADIYALGVMTYELLAGHTPFSGDTPSELMHAHVYEPPPSIRAARPDLQESVGIVLEKALAKGREARFQSGSAFAEAFRIALTGKVPAWLEQGVPPGPETANVAAGFSRRRPSRRLPTSGPELGDGRQPVSRRVGLLTIGMVVIIGIVALAMIVLASRAGDAGQGTPTATSQLAAAPSATPAVAIPAVQTAERETSTATATATRTGTPSRTASATPTETPDIPATVAVIVGQTDTAVALLPSPTPTGTPSATPSATPTEIPTETPDIPATVALIVGQTDTAVALLASPTPTGTPSSTSSATPTEIPTETPDIPATVAVIVGQTDTAVALLASPTPTTTPSFTPSATPSATPTEVPTETPDIPATVAQMVGQTDTAVALLPSPTPTGTPSFTPSVTWTPSATPSATFTQTPTATATPSLTATTPPTATPTFTPSETHTETPDIPATVAQIVGMTETAVALLPSLTLTETPSFTPSATFTPTLTATWTPTATARDTAVPATLTSTPAPTVPLPPTPELCEYVVAAGDYPFSIASSMGVTVEGLMAANGLSNPVLLQVGQVLVNPKCASPATPPAPGGAVPAVTRNADWGPVVQSFDSVDMVLVPPGCFQMGSNRLFLDEEPVTDICFESPFWIDRFEVSNAPFERLNGVAAQSGRWNLPDRPREQISWFEARDFCLSRGARLPTEAEWEFAARGPDGLTWPWGHTFQPENVVYGGNSGGETASVGSRTGGASWVGALDMSGNVREWVSSLYIPYPYRKDDGREADTAELANSPRVLRGGTFDLLNGTDGSVRAMRRAWSGPNYGSETDGFRCARDFAPAASPLATETTIAAPTDPSAIGVRVIITGTSVNLRAGPGTGFARLSGAARGETFPVTARTATGNWYQVTLPDGREAWVSAGLVQLSPADASIPVAPGTSGTGS